MKIRWKVFAAVLILLSGDLRAQRLADFAPRPKPLSAEVLAQPCVKSNLLIDEGGVGVMVEAGLLRAGVASDKAQMAMSSNVSGVLVAWAGAHFPKQRWMVGGTSPRDACTDWTFLVTQWQLASGATASGSMRVEDVQLMVNVIAKAKAGVQQAQENAITRDAECRASAPQLFGMPIGCELALSACPTAVFQGQQTATQTCAALDPYDNQWRSGRRDVRLRFAPNEQPGWVQGSPTIELLNGAIMGLSMQPSDFAAAKHALSGRFGPARVVVNRAQNAFGVEYVVSTTTYWSGDGLNASLSDALGSLIKINSPALVRAEAEMRQRRQDDQNQRKATTGRAL